MMSTPASRLGYLVLLTLSFLAPATVQAKTLCCNDAKGVRTCGDILPPACYDRAYFEIVGGRVVREVEAPLTPEQRAKKDAELRVQRDKLAKEAEARRRDQVLLDSYSSIGELDRRRDREVGNVEGELKAARAREADLLAQQVQLEKGVTARSKPSRTVTDKLAINASELDAVRTIITSKQRELEAIRARFDADHDRYLQLTGQADVRPNPQR